MSSVTLGRRLGNRLYQIAFPIYRPLYSAFKARSDRAERLLLANNLLDGAIAVDAGANIGIYSRFLSKCVGRGGAVHSFEPSPENFFHLAAAVSSLPNVLPHQCAVGAESGSELLYVSDKLNVDHRLFPAEGETRRTVSIKVVSLDDYFKPGARVDFIKLDIQGYEFHALRGAARVLKDNPAIKILLEFWPCGLREAGSSARHLLEWLDDNNFSVARVGEHLPGHGYTDSMDSDPAKYYNLFAQRSGVK